MSLLVICEILGLFINTWTAEDKYFLRSSENFPQPIKMQRSRKQKTFYQVFAAFLKFTFKFKYFEKKK